MASSLLDYALSYAARGWYVFPCREKPGAPFIRNGETIIPEEKLHILQMVSRMQP